MLWQTTRLLQRISFFRLLQILHLSFAFHPPADWLVSRSSDTAVPKVAGDPLVAVSSGRVLNHTILNLPQRYTSWPFLLACNSPPFGFHDTMSSSFLPLL